MSNAEAHHEIVAFEAPLPGELVGELIDFWQGLFQADYAPFRGILGGKGLGQNRDIVYVVKRGGKVIGTSHLTISELAPELGGLGEVGTAEEFRGGGIAGALCGRGRDDFVSAGGQALVLGTGNPAAMRVYERLGWRKVAGANVMALIGDGRPVREFLAGYFGHGDVATVAVGTAGDRIGMIPLLVYPHDEQVLDANLGLYSTRYAVQKSCMGLYPRYETLAADGRGAWFVGRTAYGCLPGMSTARLDYADGCQVDGFTHPGHGEVWESLLEAAIAWAADHGAASCWSRVLIEDEDRISRFEDMGFGRDGEDEPFDLGGRDVQSVRLERHI